MKKIVNISLWFLFVVVTLVLLSFTNSKKQNSVCKNVEVKVDANSGNHFVTKKRVNTILRNIGFKRGEDKFGDIDTEKIEKKIMSLSSVENVEVFKNMNGTLEVDVKQRNPIARIINNGGNSLYVDDKGKTMQISNFFTARVLVVTGFVDIRVGESYEGIKNSDSLMNRTRLDEVFKLATYIDKDPFLKAQIEQIYVQRNKEIILIPKIGQQEIIFGDITNLEAKFEKLKLFYTKGINPSSLNLYKTINLKFNNQIVCKKNK